MKTNSEPSQYYREVDFDIGIPFPQKLKISANPRWVNRICSRGLGNSHWIFRMQ